MGLDNPTAQNPTDAQAALGDMPGAPQQAPASTPTQALAQTEQTGFTPGPTAQAATSGPVVTPPSPAQPDKRWQDMRAARRQGSFAQKLARAADKIGVPAGPGGWARSLVGAAQVALSGIADSDIGISPEVGGAATGAARVAAAKRAQLMEQQRYQQKQSMEQNKQMTESDKAHAEIAASNARAAYDGILARKGSEELRQEDVKVGTAYLDALQNPDITPEGAKVVGEKDMPLSRVNELMKSNPEYGYSYAKIATASIDGEERYTLVEIPKSIKLTPAMLDVLSAAPRAKGLVEKGEDGKYKMIGEDGMSSPQNAATIHGLWQEARSTLLNTGARATRYGDLNFVKKFVDFNNDQTIQKIWQQSGGWVPTAIQALEHQEQVERLQNNGHSALADKYPNSISLFAAQLEEEGKPGSGMQTVQKELSDVFNKNMGLWNPKTREEAETLVANMEHRDKLGSTPDTQADLGRAKDILAAKIKGDADAAGANEAARLAEEEKSLAGKGVVVPPNFQYMPDSFHSNPKAIRQNLEQQGVAVPSNFEALYAIGHYKGDLKSLPTRTVTRPGVPPQMDQTTGMDFIRRFINPPDANGAGGWDEKTYHAVQGLEDSFAHGKDAQAMQSFNAATGHLAQLYDVSRALATMSPAAQFPIINKIALDLSAQLGIKVKPSFEAIKGVLVGEVGRLMKNAAPDVEEMAKLNETLSTYSSPEQFADISRQYAHAMLTKGSENLQRYYAWTGELPPYAFSPAAKTAFQKLGVDINSYLPQATTPQGTVNSPTQPATRTPAPPATIQWQNMPGMGEVRQRAYKGNQVWVDKNNNIKGLVSANPSGMQPGETVKLQ